MAREGEGGGFGKVAGAGAVGEKGTGRDCSLPVPGVAADYGVSKGAGVAVTHPDEPTTLSALTLK